ncbi:O-antigen ligase family protein [Flavonifractor sp. An82]|uniref:O-antigen ligase family protein n=1 Tax=Flavonifractor sp. An82 TaxID=1965660 RepID=UPI00112271C1|nr:O-antigen ligase family protein [Flavonifractor sp. An82]
MSKAFSQYSKINSPPKRGLIFYLVVIACFITIISQMPALVEVGISSAISSIVWIIVFFVLCIVDKEITIYKDLKLIIIMSTTVLAFWGIASVFDKSYSYSDIPRQMALSMFIMVIGSMCGKHIDRNMLKACFTVYVWATLAVTISIYFSYIKGSSINNIIYAYSSKNSVSQIILTSIILTIINKLTCDRPFAKIIYSLITAFNVYMLIALKSRACLIMLPIIILVILCTKDFNKKIKTFLVIILFIITLAFLFSPELYEIIINQVMLGGRKGTGLDSLSSGRFSQWRLFWADFTEYPLFGKGGRHRESLILTSYLEYGFFFGSLILIIACYPIIWCIKKITSKDALFTTLFLIVISYIINGVFEMLAPFGPGVKCFMMWFLMGLITTIKYKEMF